MEFIEKVTETIIGYLLGVNVLFDGKLNFTQEHVHKQNVDEYVSGAQVESILDPNYLEWFSFLTDLLDLLENSDNLGFSRLYLASEKICNLEGYQIDIHVFNVLFIKHMIFL